MTYGRPFKLYRIVCTINGKALINGSDCPHTHRNPPLWYKRGEWGNKGAFWRSREGVNKHLRQLCHDWSGRHVKCDCCYSGLHWVKFKISQAPDWSRLDHLVVEETEVHDYRVYEINAPDFIGLLTEVEP